MTAISGVWAFLGVALLAATGCKRQIGDDCTSSTNCSITGDRLCDVTQPGGYCTIFNCEPNSCPDDSVCVAFGEASCSSPALSGRFQRTFCLLSCESNEDCRSGYQCFDTSSDLTRRVVDPNPSSRRVCTVPRAPAAMPPVVDPPICFPSDASFESSLPPRPESGPGDGPAAEAILDGSSGEDAGDALADRSASPDDGATDEPDGIVDEPDGDDLSDAPQETGD